MEPIIRFSITKSQASEYNPLQAQNKLYNVLKQHEIQQYSTATL